MFLSARMLTNVAGVNQFDYATETRLALGNPQDVYFQLVDADQHPLRLGFQPFGLRYMPAAGATVSVEFTYLDSSKVFARAATNPFPDDRSVWRVSVLATDPLNGTVNLKITLTEGAVVRTFFVPAGLVVSGFGEVC